MAIERMRLKVVAWCAGLALGAGAGGCGPGASSATATTAADASGAFACDPGAQGAVQGTFTGRVTAGVEVALHGDSESMDPLQIIDRTTTTDAAGRYCFAPLPAGFYAITPVLPAGQRFVEVRPAQDPPVIGVDQVHVTVGPPYVLDFQTPECVAEPSGGSGGYMNDYQGGCPAGQVCDTGDAPLPAGGHCIPEACPLPSPLSCSLAPCPDGYACDMTKTGAGPQCACMADGSWMCQMAAYPGACVKQ